MAHGGKKEGAQEGERCREKEGGCVVLGEGDRERGGVGREGGREQGRTEGGKEGGR